MKKRTILLGTYDTAAYGWTLARCKITKGTQVQTFVSVPGRFAPLDLSTTLMDGQPYYDNAALDVLLECSEGDRDAREALINTLVNYLDGRSVPIVHPDHPDHYLVGRAQVNPEYSDLAHCAVVVSAVCEPWLWAAEETVVRLAASATEQEAILQLSGRLAVVPTIAVTGEVTLTFGGSTWTLSAGEHVLPGLCLAPSERPGEPAEHTLGYSGDGSIVLRYREAVLAA